MNEWMVETIARDEVKQRVQVEEEEEEEERRSRGVWWMRKEEPFPSIFWGGLLFVLGAVFRLHSSLFTHSLSR
jgi:hypothetical protein